jgi:hypothetical protein
MTEIEEKAVRMVERYGGRPEAIAECNFRAAHSPVHIAYFYHCVARAISEDLSWSGKNVELAPEAANER